MKDFDLFFIYCINALNKSCFLLINQAKKCEEKYKIIYIQILVNCIELAGPLKGQALIHVQFFFYF